MWCYQSSYFQIQYLDFKQDFTTFHCVRMGRVWDILCQGFNYQFECSFVSFFNCFHFKMRERLIISLCGKQHVASDWGRNALKEFSQLVLNIWILVLPSQLNITTGENHFNLHIQLFCEEKEKVKQGRGSTV